MSVTYFDTLRRNYADVPITEDGICTVSFLEATEGLVKLFDLLGSAAFTIVQNDMNGNVKKIRERFEFDSEKNRTLEQLIINERGEKKRIATEGLLWLKRGLEFTSVALRRSKSNENEELSVSFTVAYGSTLKKFHSFVVRPVFVVAMKAVPNRVEFFKKLGDDEAKISEQYEIWLKSLEKIVDRLNEFYIAGSYDKGL